MHRRRILFLPFFTECRQLAHGLFFCICLIYLLEVFHEFLDVFIAYKTCAAADLVDDASVTRDGLKQIQVRLNKEQMTHGLRMMLLEVRDDNLCPFFIQEYPANKFLRAHFNDTMISGESMADMVLLNESTVENDISSWQYRKSIRLRVLGLDKNMEYYQRQISPVEIHELDIYNPPDDGKTVYPAYRNRRFNRIPLVWCGSSGLSGSSMEYPLMLSMAQTELKLFLCMAHNSQHSLHPGAVRQSAISLHQWHRVRCGREGDHPASQLH